MSFTQAVNRSELNSSFYSTPTDHPPSSDSLLSPLQVTYPWMPFSMAPQSYDVPAELLACILDNVRDRATLKSCSLACSSWTYFAQSRLFHEVIVDSDAKLRKLAALLRQSIHLSAHIRVLHIKLPQTLANAHLIQMNTWIHDIPEHLAQHLTMLNTLHFTRVDFELVDGEYASEFTKFPGIRKLELTFCKFAHFGAFQDMLRPFTRSNKPENKLESLSMDEVSWGDPPMMECDTPQVEPPMLSLKRLEIARHSKPHAMLQWLLVTPGALANLKEVVFQQIYPENLPDVGTFLYHLGSNLEHLTLGFKFDRAPALQEMLNDHLRLHVNTNLQTLHLRIMDNDPCYMTWVTAILSDLALVGGPTLRRLTFDIWLWNRLQLNSYIWGNIQTILNSPRYCSLEEVRFISLGHVVMPEAMGYDKTREAMHARLPELFYRRILRVSDGKECTERPV
ncbi:hypothetical protein EIP86_005597 [Pleurotus ostreatoroseus]|nr:hypothetical protein EIP86_005597 [Pleurotus ostreatoroseus]